MLDVREFAIQIHGEQRYGEHPYVYHLDQVWNVLCQYGYGTPSYMVGAYLHDALEDHPSCLPLIEQTFPDILPILRFCTDEPGANRRERKAATYARCRRDLNNSVFPHPLMVAVRIKLADRLANLRHSKGSDLFKMYRKEQQAFRDALYLPHMCDPMWAEYNETFGENRDFWINPK